MAGQIEDNDRYQQYSVTIASRKALLDLLTQRKKPLAPEKIAELLGYAPDDLDHIKGLNRRLNAMARDGQLLKNRKNHYGVPAKMDLVTGTVEGHPDGFGFLTPETGGKDIYIPPNEMRRLMHGDTVMAHIREGGKRRKKEANIVEVLHRAHQKLVVRYYREGKIGMAIPVNKRICHEILIPDDENMQTPDNHMALVEIIRYPDKKFTPIGKIVEVLGEHMAPGLEITVALHSWGIPYEWAREVSHQASSIPDHVEPSHYADRVNLMDLPLVTIDGEDARDFDDALWCKRTLRGWKAIVAIADVSEYVHTDSPLDTEAVKRGTSVYFPDHVVPMLPESLSNGICSLNPDVPRLCLACEMLFNRQGKLLRSKFFKAIMRSHARLTYTDVGQLFDGEPDSQQLGEDFPVLWTLRDLYQALQKRRLRRGVIDFSLVETKIQFGDDRKIADIVPQTRNDAHKLVEELMISANVCAGKFLLKHKIPGLFRVHEQPSTEKVEDVREFLGEFGLKLASKQEPSPGDYAALLDEARKRPEFSLIQTVMLRSLRQAHYTPINDGHFGLARDVYAHFTSPIRRYPDLLVHRAITHILNGGKAKNYSYSKADMIKLGDHCSTTERRADDATRDVVSWLKCEYMQDKLGEVFSGIISSVTNFGLFVEVADIYIEGLVHISALPSDYYHFDAVRHQLGGENSGRKFRLGDQIQVQLANVNLDERKIDFTLPDHDIRDPRTKQKRNTAD
jgi:ribonuclease R